MNTTNKNDQIARLKSKLKREASFVIIRSNDLANAMCKLFEIQLREGNHPIHSF